MNIPPVRSTRIRPAWRAAAVAGTAWLAFWMPVAAPAQTSRPPLVVTLDDNYPPYVFRNADGKVEGYLVDLWALWQKKSGRKVELIATSWTDAQQMIQNGNADVIDLIYRTPPRESLYDFSKPYADLSVLIYNHASISGIRNVETLRGFQIGVQDGDPASTS